MNHPENMSDQGKRLIHYFKHPDRFLFGLVNKKQREVYAWLEKKGFVDGDGGRYQGTYTEVETAMVNNQGIRKIIEDLIIPQVNVNFSEYSRRYLSEKWKNNEVPNIGDLEKNSITYRTQSYGGCTFLETSIINGETHVDRWSDFAKLYFIELENLKWESNQSNVSISENPKKTQVTLQEVPTATKRLFEVLEKLTYNAKDNKNQQMIEKVFVLLSLSALSETKPIFDQLSRIIDFGQLLSLVTTESEDLIVGESKNG